MSFIRSHQDLIHKLKQNGCIKTKHVEEAMRVIDRGWFIPLDQRQNLVYNDCPMPLGFGATISAPHMHALCLEHLSHVLRPGAKVLDIGSGSGYMTAVMAQMIRGDPDSLVVGIEHVPELAHQSMKLMIACDSMQDLLRDVKIIIKQGDGFEGYSAESPFDCIHVGAAAREVPEALQNQLGEGGRLIIPIGEKGSSQSLTIVDKKLDGSIVIHSAGKVIYVPLTTLRKQLGHDVLDGEP